MQKIYIDKNNAIWVDPDCTRITFDSVIDGKKRPPIEIGNDQLWKLFRCLFLNRNTPLSNETLYEACGMKSTKTSNKGNLQRCMTNLRNRFSYDGKNEEVKAKCLFITEIKETKDDNSLAIINTAETHTLLGEVAEKGTYTLYTPTQSDWVMETISSYYWDAYSTIGAQKYSGRYDTSVNRYDLNKKFGEVFQTPRLISSHNGDEWNWSHESSNNRFLVAPNGFGKTAFLRSLLLSCISDYNTELTDSEKEKYKKIKETLKFPVNNKYLPLYLECQYINFDLLEADLKNSNHSWIYLALCERLRINRLVSENAFFQSVSSHLESSGVILLIDGFDEIPKANRKKLYTALKKYQESTNFNSNLSVVIATRPLSITEEFIGFDKWYLADVKQNPDYLRAYVNAYAGSEKAEEIITQISKNHYLNELITTPATLVWTIKTCLDKKPVYEAVEMIMTEVMRRNNYSELRTQESAYKIIYAELAYKYLTQLTNDSKGIDCSEYDFFSWLHNTLDSLAKRGERKIIKLLDTKSDEELEQLFFTQVALMEFDTGRLRFSTPVYTYHLVARRILSLLDSLEPTSLLKDLSRIPYNSRYKAIVATLTLGEHCHESKFDDISYDSTTDMKQLLADMFYEYLSAKLSDSAIMKEEKKAIYAAIDDILSERYGSNVFTGDGHNPSYNRSFEKLLGK